MPNQNLQTPDPSEALTYDYPPSIDVGVQCQPHDVTVKSLGDVGDLVSIQIGGDGGRVSIIGDIYDATAVVEAMIVGLRQIADVRKATEQ